jgi:hypothetical protein
VTGLTYDGPLNSSGWGLLLNGSVNYSDSRTTRTINLDTNNLPITLAHQEVPNIFSDFRLLAFLDNSRVNSVACVA